MSLISSLGVETEPKKLGLGQEEGRGKKTASNSKNNSNWLKNKNQSLVECPVSFRWGWSNNSVMSSKKWSESSYAQLALWSQYGCQLFSGGHPFPLTSNTRESLSRYFSAEELRSFFPRVSCQYLSHLMGTTPHPRTNQVPPGYATWLKSTFGRRRVLLSPRQMNYLRKG